MLEKRKGIPSCKGYYDSKSGIKYHYDSMTELAMMMYMDDNDLKWEKNTKFRIPYLFEGKQRNYIPDFFIDEVDRRIILEIKGSDDKPELPFKCKAAKKYCEENEMYFQLMPYALVRELVNWNKVKEYHNAHK